MGSGTVLLALGMAALGSLPLPLPFRLLLISAWAATGVRGLVLTSSGHARCRKIRLHAGGQVELLAPGGDWCCARLGDGCVVLGTIAWLRLEAGDGTCFGELLRGSVRDSEEWRRFQVIWRHLGRAA